MKSTGEVMGIDADFGTAFAKSQIAAGQNSPVKGNVFVSVQNRDKRDIVYIVKKLVDLGFTIVPTSGDRQRPEKERYRRARDSRRYRKAAGPTSSHDEGRRHCALESTRGRQEPAHRRVLHTEQRGAVQCAHHHDHFGRVGVK